MTPDLLDAPSARVAPGAVRAALRAVPTLPGALTAPQRRRAVVIRRPPPWVVACFLARAVQGDAACAAIHEAAAQLLALLTLDAADPMLGLAMGRAITLRDAAAALPEADRAPVVVAMLRDLLDDAPTRAAVEMDQALVRAAPAWAGDDGDDACADLAMDAGWTGDRCADCTEDA